MADFVDRRDGAPARVDPRFSSRIGDAREALRTAIASAAARSAGGCLLDVGVGRIARMPRMADRR